MDILPDLQKHTGNARILADRCAVFIRNIIVFDNFIEYALSRCPRFVCPCILDALSDIAGKAAIGVNAKLRNLIGYELRVNFPHGLSPYAVFFGTHGLRISALCASNDSNRHLCILFVRVNAAVLFCRNARPQLFSQFSDRSFAQSATCFIVSITVPSR